MKVNKKLEQLRTYVRIHMLVKNMDSSLIKDFLDLNDYKTEEYKKSYLLDLCNYLLEDEISILESEITEYLNSIYNTDFTVKVSLQDDSIYIILSFKYLNTEFYKAFSFRDDIDTRNKRLILIDTISKYVYENMTKKLEDKYNG